MTPERAPRSTAGVEGQTAAFVGGVSRELDARVEAALGVTPRTRTVVSNDGGRSACAWVDRREGPWWTSGQLSEWLREQKSKGIYMDYIILDVPDPQRYSSDIAAAFEVVENLRARGWMIVVSVASLVGVQVRPVWHAETEAELRAAPHFYASADTAPLAICIAALAAIAATAPSPHTPHDQPGPSGSTNEEER